MYGRVPLIHYLAALAATGLAIVMRLGLDPWLVDHMPFVTLYGAIAVAVWIGGYGPAIVAALTGFLVSDWLFLERGNQFGIHGVQELLALVAYGTSCAIIIGLGTSARISRDRARHEAAELRRTREYLNRLADAMPQLVWTAGPDGRVDYFNAKRAEYAGAATAWNHWELMIHPDDRADTWAAWEQANASSRAYEMEHRIQLADGSHRWHLSRALPAFDADGRVIKWFGTATDIDRLKRAEEAVAETSTSLTRERERLEMALRTGQMGVYEWRPAEHMLWWSPEIYPVYGVDPASFSPTADSFTALIHPDDRAEVWRKTQASIAERNVFIHEYRVIRPDGEIRWVFNRSQVGVGADGQVERLTGVALDITDRKRAEEELIEADRRKDEFIATLAHELRNPLAPIRNAVRLLGLHGSGQPGLAWPREVIERQVAHMARLLDDLLDISRISRNRVNLQFSRVTLASVIDAAVETSRPLIDGANHELHVSVPPTPIWLTVDAVRLAQVFSNLLNNAAKFTRRGGQIWLTAAHEEPDLAVSVRDTGVGIAPELLPHVFEMFTHDKPSLERGQGGLGIGLALAKGLVEAMGGRIEVHSDGPDRGTEFTVRLPLATAEKTQERQPRDQSVEDDPATLARSVSTGRPSNASNCWGSTGLTR